MKAYTKEELQEILQKHKLWLDDDAKGERADLSGSNLSGSNLSYSNLSGSNLRGSNLSGSNLRGSNLSYSNLSGSNLSGAVGIDFPMSCPDTGAFIGWKRVRNNLIVKLEIPEDARRSSSTGRKCRCDKAKVIAIENIDGTKANCDVAVSKYDEDFTYVVGETVEEPAFLPNRWEECAPGIHFFINRQEAVDYE